MPVLVRAVYIWVTNFTGKDLGACFFKRSFQNLKRTEFGRCRQAFSLRMKRVSLFIGAADFARSVEEKESRSSMGFGAIPYCSSAEAFSLEPTAKELKTR